MSPQVVQITGTDPAKVHPVKYKYVFTFINISFFGFAGMVSNSLFEQIKKRKFLEVFYLDIEFSNTYKLVLAGYTVYLGTRTSCTHPSGSCTS